jgi:hypothetical protein
VWVAGDPDSRIPAELALGDDRLTITSGEIPIGDWSLSELEIAGGDPYVRIEVEGERLVVDLTEPARFTRLARPRPERNSELPLEPASTSDLSDIAALRPAPRSRDRRKSKQRGRHLR